MKRITTLALAIFAVAGISLTGCNKKGGKGISLQNVGSDTMVNLAQAWAEAYHGVKPDISVEVLGGGSGVGISSLINGTCDIANSSRKLEKEEEEKATAKYGGKHPTEHLVGYDALAIYVHPSNPITDISVEQLSEIYKAGGKFTKWSEIGVTMPAGQDQFVLASRQSNSGTYHYFREAVLGKKSDMRQGAREMSGSKDVVELVAGTPSAIGFSGIGYRTDKVKVIRVSKKTGEPSVEPTIQTTLDKTYPIARPMFMYVPPTAKPEAEEYIKWILTAPGQKIVIESGYVPLAEFAPKDAK
jgi:phosphate transport system substrate-binding protein